MTVTGEPRWLDDDEQHSWRALMMGMTLLLERLAQLNDAGDGGVRPLHLTEREVVLLPLLATDDSVPEIARRLMVSVNTVRKQVVTLREKFGADTRAELVRRARTYGALS